MLNNSLPKISIVTVSFNQGQFLETTIKSVLNQNYPNLEYIIIDGGSTDNSVEIIQKYEDNLAYWVSEPDGGQSEAIQKGLDKCTGDIFNWLCSDDYLEPKALHKIAHAFSINKEAHLVCGLVREFNLLGTRDHIGYGTQIRNTIPKTICETFITQPSTFWKIEIFREIGIDFTMHWFMDYEMWFRYLLNYGTKRVIHIDELISHYLFHENSKSQLESDYTQTRKTSKYKIDINTIFYRFCEYVKYKEKLDILRSLSSEIVPSYSFKPIASVDNQLAKQIVNQYLYTNAKRYYWINDFPYAARLFNAVDSNYLNPNDLEEFKKLKFRSVNEVWLSVLRKIPVLRKIKKLISNG
jgi:glycosyltransferase involved in cell wall biosynthesis